MILSGLHSTDDDLFEILFDSDSACVAQRVADRRIRRTLRYVIECDLRYPALVTRLSLRAIP